LKGAGVYVSALSKFARELEVAALAAREAGAIILGHYERGAIAVDTKADASPVTAADRDANRAIVARLVAAFPDDAVLSEELPDDGTRHGKQRVWIVDPLDGTRDFIARTDDFCVHIGLAVAGVPVVGAVFQPTAGALYFAADGGGAFVESDGGRVPLRVAALVPAEGPRVGVTRTAATGQLRTFLADTGLGDRAVSMGASVKVMALARGALDAVVNLRPDEQDWDTCAPDAILREAGGRYTDTTGQPFIYNGADIIHRRGSLAASAAAHPVMLGLLRPYAHFDGAGGAGS
jgi:3'(2'),5'-bisphosphate nucleotidase